MENYKILLDDNCESIVNEEILIKIPFIKNIIDKHKNDITINNKTTINLKSINSIIFGYIITLIKFNKVNLEASSDMFNNNFIKNMNIDTLIDFIITTNYLSLEKLKELAIGRFMNIFKNKEVGEIRNEFKIEDDFNYNEKNNFDQNNNWN